MIRPGVVRGEHFHRGDDGRLVCDLCPRHCQLRDGQRAFCFVRKAEGDRIVLDSYGRASGFCIDPIEKKPLNHFFPGSSVLSFGTAGCNLGCRYCQNWDISKARESDRLQDWASPERIVQAAGESGCRSIAFTYNDPVIFAEYAMDTAALARASGIHTVAVTAGYITAEARGDFFRDIDAVNVDLKAFSERFYAKLCFASLAPVLETLLWLRHESPAWLEITTLLIPGHNDSEAEVESLVKWIAEHLGADVPLHFSAFHPDFKMREVPPTPPATLARARSQALALGLRHVYTGNVHDRPGQSTYCSQCGALLIERDWYEIGAYNLDPVGRCLTCGTTLAGHFAEAPDTWGAKRQRLVL